MTAVQSALEMLLRARSQPPIRSAVGRLPEPDWPRTSTTTSSINLPSELSLSILIAPHWVGVQPRYEWGFGQQCIAGKFRLWPGIQFGWASLLCRWNVWDRLDRWHVHRRRRYR